MNISKDFKIGIMGLIVIVIFLLIVNFVQQSGLFNPGIKISAMFASATGIEVKNPVFLKGLPIGSVEKMESADEKMSGVKVTLKIDKDIPIPINSVATVAASGPMSPNKIIIEKGNSNSHVEDGDIIQGKSDEKATNLKARVQPLGQKIKNITDSLSAVLSQYNAKLNTKKQAELRDKITSLNRQMEGYAALTQRWNKSVNSSLSNAVKATDGFDAKEVEINKMLQNANTKTNELAQMNLERSVDSLNKQINVVRKNLGSLSGGKLNALTKNRETYNSLNEQLTQSEILLDDIRINPKRYIDYSVFGKTSKSSELTESEESKQKTQRNIRFNRRQQKQYKNN